MPQKSYVGRVFMHQDFIKNQNNPISMVSSKKLPLIYDSYANESIIFQWRVHLLNWMKRETF